MMHENEGPGHDPEKGDELNGEGIRVTHFEDMFELVMFLGNMSSVDHLTPVDIDVLEGLANGTYSGHVEVNTDGEYATDRRHYALPAIMSSVEAISSYREEIDEFSEGPFVSPELLSRAIEALSTLGKTVVGVYLSGDGTLENAEKAKILYIPSGGSFSMTNRPS
jgi:hypothetical protein